MLRYLTLGMLFGLTMLVAGCFGGKGDTGHDPSTSPGGCEAVYTYAPAMYTINIVAGDAVVLDPLSQDFPLFCDPAAAKAFLKKELDAGRLPSSIEWHAYHVWGEWNDLAEKGPDGVYILKRSAPLVDWVK